MPRKPRFYLPDVPAHIVQRGNCRQAVFFSDDDYAAYLRWLHEACLKHGCRIHAYVLMTNHVHLLMTPNSRESISRAIQDTGRYYVRYVNRCHGRSGTLWEGRHKGCVISDDRICWHACDTSNSTRYVPGW
jgi:putative transposase